MGVRTLKPSSVRLGYAAVVPKIVDGGSRDHACGIEDCLLVGSQSRVHFSAQFNVKACNCSKFRFS